jgi:hypothetical protein
MPLFTPIGGGGVTYGSATGGTSSSITIGGIPTTLLTFTSSGTLTVSKAGIFDMCIVGGGGRGTPGGERNNAAGGGGGGGGVLIPSPVYLTAGTYSVTVGGASSDAGNFSAVGTIIAPGGGYSYGGQDASITQRQPANGNATGAGGNGSFTTGGTGITGLGFNGGNYASGDHAGGGGGAGAAGSNGVANTAGGAGGAGKDISTFLGQSAGTTFKGGGGGGAGANAGGAGGTGGGGAGGTGATAGTAGTANSGGGGGGARNQYVAGGNGGSGIVYVRFTS